ncbi:hypothetical protein SAMN05216571_101257 [Onishia taeanensis]|uniref:Nucleotide-diphospho-sugar transferase n=1 Tax=Onishia taeanensis TaxID=284577 RepID=A0A1G7N6N6_9GAMM|nr:hypothetical protein [Halomonas taeanensis]SDF69664.1 hypothetical protein SAMN05216571_101257 [Halomonas taeanensis]
MVRRVCVLRSGGEFGPEHVQWLAGRVDLNHWLARHDDNDIQCLSDVEVRGVPTIPLAHGWPGWWAKMELFRPDLPGDLIYLDLDTVVLYDLEPLIAAAAGRTTLLSDFYRPAQPASGLMYIAERDKARVWAHWMRDPAGHMARARTTACWGDQGILRQVLGDGVQRWQDVAQGQVVSYKAHCRQGIPAAARVVCFHGNPRPWAARDSNRNNWIPPLC